MDNKHHSYNDVDGGGGCARDIVGVPRLENRNEGCILVESCCRWWLMPLEDSSPFDGRALFFYIKNLIQSYKLSVSFL